MPVLVLPVYSFGSRTGVGRCRGARRNIDARTWDRLKAKLQANSKEAGVRHDAVPWLHVIYCDECKAMMYRTVVTNRQGRKFRLPGQPDRRHRPVNG